MILLDKLSQALPAVTDVLRLDERPIVLRVHQDVVNLAEELAARDRPKLLKALDTMFFPAAVTWFEWQAGERGDVGIMFAGTPDVRKGNAVYYAWEARAGHPHVAIPIAIDFEAGTMKPDIGHIKSDHIAFLASYHAGIEPMILALLALINAPKMVRRLPRNVDKINRKRAAVGKYTFHPHHTVRLNVDRRTFTVQEGGGGDGASRALHHVRAHLRFTAGKYGLVQPYWRGDPAIGIRRTSYEVDRSTSRWTS